MHKGGRRVGIKDVTAQRLQGSSTPVPPGGPRRQSMREHEINVLCRAVEAGQCTRAIYGCPLVAVDVLAVGAAGYLSRSG
jgi:hypothetical protein